MKKEFGIPHQSIDLGNNANEDYCRNKMNINRITKQYLPNKYTVIRHYFSTKSTKSAQRQKTGAQK
jgi:hypothetical protein